MSAERARERVLKVRADAYLLQTGTEAGTFENVGGVRERSLTVAVCAYPDRYPANKTQPLNKT